MASAFASTSRSQGLSPGQGHCVLFLGRHSITVPLFTQEYQWAQANLILRVKPYDELASYPGGRNAPNQFMLHVHIAETGEMHWPA